MELMRGEFGGPRVLGVDPWGGVKEGDGIMDTSGNLSCKVHIVGHNCTSFLIPPFLCFSIHPLFFPSSLHFSLGFPSLLFSSMLYFF